MNFRKIMLCSSVLILTGTMAACTPTKANRGNLLENYQIDQVKTGEHSRSDVLRLLGSPTTVAPFDDNTWYYIGQETEKSGIMDPEIKRERIVVVAFAPDGKVAKVSDASDGRINVPVTRESTTTHGNKNSLVQQLLGNLGRFNPQEESKRQ
jgi:outer membrane protein assembly factor BamE (lipoprotein component of BamABCDE complex)